MSSAEAAQPYASLFGGLSIMPSRTMSGHNFTRTTTSLTVQSDQSVDTAFKTGFVLGGNAGIEWGNGLRTELELSYRQHSSHKHAHLKTHYSIGYSTTSGDGGAPYRVHTTLASRNSDVPANVRLRAWSLMANAWYDFDLGLPITPYIGGGVGLAQVKISGSLADTTLFEKNDEVFAWQAGAGFSIPITDATKVFVDYRYFAANGAHLKLEPGFNGGSINADFDSHSVILGLRFNF
jgi:opacity protein-like surface antigen